MRTPVMHPFLHRLATAVSALLFLAGSSLFGDPASSGHLTSVVINPTSVDVSSASQTVTITGADAYATAVSAGLTLSTDSSQTTGFIAGTVSSGTFSVTLTIPAHAGAGTWLLAIHTKEGSPSVNFSTKNLVDAGFPSSITVISTTADTAAPQLVSFSLSPATIDTTSADRAINASFSVTDNLSGTSSVSFWFTGPDAVLYPGSTLRTGGTALSGTWTGAVTIPKGSVPGLYVLSQVTTQDSLGNTRSYYPSDLASLGTGSVQNIGKLGQTITFGPISDHTYGDAAFGLSASTSSGLPVTFSVFSGPATLSGNTLTITGAGYVTVRASQAGNGTYTAATDVDQTFQVFQAEATIVVTPYDVNYDGAAHTATGTATGLAGLDLGSLLTLSGTTHTDAGTYTTDGWTFAGNTNYKAASGTVTDKIAKVNAIITVTPYSVTYDGNPHTATGTATGVESAPADLSSLLTLTGTTHTNAGDYPADAWSFAGNTNYNPASGTVHDAIAKANATVNVAGYTGVYDGNPHGANGTATGVKGETLSGLNLGASFTEVPGGTANWTFTDATGNYNNTGGSVAITLTKANAIISVTPYNVIYDGNPHTATGTATGVKGESLTTLLSLSGTTHTNPGDYLADAWSFAGNTNYNPASGTVHDAITYGFYGLLSPYTPNKSYKIKSAIPLKWQYTNAANVPIPSGTAAPEIRILKVADYASSEGAITLDDAGSSGYQYDPTTNTWQFNWKTTGLTPGTYYIYITSGVTKQVNGPFPIQLTN